MVKFFWPRRDELTYSGTVRHFYASFPSPSPFFGGVISIWTVFRESGVDLHLHIYQTRALDFYEGVLFWSVRLNGGWAGAAVEEGAVAAGREAGEADDRELEGQGPREGVGPWRLGGGTKHREISSDWIFICRPSFGFE